MPQRASKDLVPVYSDDDERDIIWIYAEGTEGMRRRVNNRFIQARAEVGSKMTVTANPADWHHCILSEYIHHWEGPGVAGLKFSPEALNEIKAGDKHLEKALAEIKRRNPVYLDEAEDEDEASPNLPAPAESDGSASLEAAEPSGQANGTYTLSSQTVTAGLPT